MTASSTTSPSPAALRTLLLSSISALLRLETAMRHGKLTTSPSEISSRLLALNGFAIATLEAWPELPCDPEQLARDFALMAMTGLSRRQLRIEK